MPAQLLSSLPEARTAHHRDDNVYDDGILRIEHDNYYVSCDGTVLQLPLKEFLILSRLARNTDRIVSSEEIWQHAWKGRSSLNMQSLHVHIYRLRRRLALFGINIETMVNVGYRLIENPLVVERDNGV